MEPKPAGTPASTGLLHLPLIPTPKGVEYLQVGGFGPCETREAALEAAKIAGIVGRGPPVKVWVQKPPAIDETKGWGKFLSAAIRKVKSERPNCKDITKGMDEIEGFGVYYMYGDSATRVVVMEHVCDKESAVRVNGHKICFPHVHVEQVDYEGIAKAHAKFSDRRDAIENFQVLEGSGESLMAKRLRRIGVHDPSAGLVKPKFNHHIYYRPIWGETNLTSVERID